MDRGICFFFSDLRQTIYREIFFQTRGYTVAMSGTISKISFEYFDKVLEKYRIDGDVFPREDARAFANKERRYLSRTSYLRDENLWIQGRSSIDLRES